MLNTRKKVKSSSGRSSSGRSSSYQKFIQDNRGKIKKENPNLNGEEIFTLIAELWYKHKKSMKSEETKATKALPKKRTKKVDVDDDGNEIVKVKRPLNNYQKFIQDNHGKIKKENPTLNGEEIFTLIAELWNKHKKSMKEK